MKAAGIKYNEAIARNVGSFNKRFSEASIEMYIDVAKMNLESIKTKLGIKKIDTGFDGQLNNFLAEAQGKVEAFKKRTEKSKPEAPKIETPKTTEPSRVEDARTKSSKARRQAQVQ